MLAPGELTIEGVCLVSSHGRDRPWGRTVESMRMPWWAVVGVRYARCERWEEQGGDGMCEFMVGLVQGDG